MGNDLTITFVADCSPERAFDAINDVRSWWTGDVTGVSDELGAEFEYRYQDLHVSTQRITELIPGRRIAWHVVDGRIAFVEDPQEWTGTDIVFELSPVEHATKVCFTHVGLGAQLECFDSCSTAWRYYISSSLRGLMTDRAGMSG